MSAVLGDWKKCSSCKKAIKLKSSYYVCSVSTCQHKRKGFQFCSVSCWSAHVPVLRHRDAWAEERRSPDRLEEELPSQGKAQRRIARGLPAEASKPRAIQTESSEILVVVSKLKNFVKQSSDFNTSADVNHWLSQHIRELCLRASENAKIAGRKTLMARDFESLKLKG